jgi:hypothetical protein
VKKNLIFSTLPFNIWAILAMWLALRSSSKIQKKDNFNLFSAKNYHSHIHYQNWMSLVLLES